jgi:hypothetical protein
MLPQRSPELSSMLRHVGTISRRGRKGRIEGTRELVFSGLPFRGAMAFKIRIWKFCASITEHKTGRDIQSEGGRLRG